MIEVTCPSEPSTTGAYRLSWTGDATQYTVEENGVVLAELTDNATTLSGRPAGKYSYRVKAGDAWSAPCTVEVAPPSLALAFALFFVGFLVFAATVVALVQGHRRTREAHDE